MLSQIGIDMNKKRCSALVMYRWYRIYCRDWYRIYCPNYVPHLIDTQTGKWKDPECAAIYRNLYGVEKGWSACKYCGIHFEGVDDRFIKGASQKIGVRPNYNALCRAVSKRSNGLAEEIENHEMRCARRFGPGGSIDPHLGCLANEAGAVEDHDILLRNV